MSSAKLLFCDTCLILVVGLVFAIPEENVMGSTTPVPNDTLKGNCSCGGFPTKVPAAEAQPLLSQTPGLVVGCTAEGNTTCHNLCLALASATKAKGPEILCNRLKECDELKLSVFYKICDGPWAYGDMTSDEALCCQDSKPKTCASQHNVTRLAHDDTRDAV